VFFGISPSALWAAESAKPVAVLPELPAFDAALWAFHGYRLQQALAVCQEKRRVSLQSIATA
jgi:hypothetical protein